MVKFSKKLKPIFIDDSELVHIHINNYSIKEIDQFPEAIELTFSRKTLHDQNLINNKDYPEDYKSFLCNNTFNKDKNVKLRF